MCTYYFIECQHNRNEEFYNPIKKRKHAIEWMREIEEMVIKLNMIDAIRCVRNYSIVVEDANASQM